MSNANPPNESLTESPPPLSGKKVCPLASTARILGLLCWCIVVLMLFNNLVREFNVPGFGLIAPGAAFGCAVAGVTLGCIALGKIGRSKGRVAGKGAAWSGICFSGVLLVFGSLVSVPGRSREAARRMKCQANLRAIAQASQLWPDKYGNHSEYPPSMKALLDSKMIDSRYVFLCPSRGTKHRPGEFVADYECVFDRAGFQMTEVNTPINLPLAWDKRGNHPGGTNVVYQDAHVEFHPGPGAYDKIIKQVDDWIAENKPDGG